jgi:esterase
VDGVDAPVQQTGRVRSGDVSLFYRLFGETRGQAHGQLDGRTPLVIAHGLSYFSYDWIEAASALAADRQVVAVDTRGFGDSDWSASGDYGVPTLARDLIAVLDQFGWKEAVLIGHSMSGRATSYCAAGNPGRIKGLALIDFSPENAPAGSRRVTAKVAAQPDVFESVDAAMRFFDVDPDSAAGKAKRARFEAYLKPVPGGQQLKRDLYFRNQFRRVLETGEKAKPGVDMWQTIGKIACPILSMRGTRSDMYAPEAVTKMRAANPRLSVVEVDAGHNIAGENLPGFLAALAPFLTSLEQRHDHPA